MPPSKSSPQSPSKSPPPNSGNPNFKELEIIRDPDGVIMVITERVSDGRVSFTLAREFEQMIDGKAQTKRSAYLAPRHVPAVMRLIADANDREILQLHEDRTRTRRRAS